MKVFVTTLALLSLFALNSQGQSVAYRKCFPVTTPGPTAAPTTQPPTSPPTDPPTTTTTQAPTTTEAPTTTSTTTVTTTTVAGSCSNNLVPYNPSVDPTAPVGNAVLAGNYFDGSDAYVGVIQYPSTYCNNQRTIPARLKATGTNPGGYAECIVENYVGNSAFYLQNDPNFIWVDANITNVVSVPNLVHYTNAYGWNFAYGRVQSTATNGSTYWSVGKIHVDGQFDYRLYTWGQSGPIVVNSYQVLACRGSVNPTPVPTQPPTTTAASTAAPTTQAPTTQAPTTQAPTTQAPTTQAPTTQASTAAPTTPTTTAAPAPKYQCAVWMRYIGDDAPAHIGFNAGISARSQTPAYVGFGMWGSILHPGRVQITNSSVGASPKTAGVYIPYPGIEWQVPYGEFLVAPNGCSCSWVDASSALSRGGIVFAGNENLYKYAVGRKVFGDGTVAISRVYTDTANVVNYLKQAYFDASGIERYEPAGDVLVCESDSPPTGPPSINFPTEACGVWSSIGMPNAVTTNGFNAGTSIANNNAWIGRGLGAPGGLFEAGRYQNEPVTGTYTPLLIDHYAAANHEWLIVPQNCTCRWMAPNAGKARKGLITTSDAIYNFMVSLHKFSTGQVSIGTARIQDSYEYYTNVNRLWNIGSYATSVLVCENIPPPPQGCGLWASYLGDNAPEVNGFSAETSAYTNTTAYVGFGVYGDRKFPARVQTTTTSTGALPRTPGAYVAFGIEYQVTYPEYLVVRDSCTCSWMVPSIASSRPGMVLTGDIVDSFAVGRKKFADGRVAITRVYTDATSINYMKNSYFNPNTGLEVLLEAATEILVCETIASTATPPVFTYTNEACAVWSTLNMVTSAASNGFAVGPSVLNQNITAYVGRGHYTLAEYRPGRYQDESPTGTYTFIVGEQIMDLSTFLIVPQDCNCYWMPPEQALVRRGLVATPDDSYHFGVGFKNFSTSVSIARVYLELPLLDEYWVTTANLQGFDYALNVKSPLLVCENIDLPPQNACGLWVYYNGDASPTINGFNAGKSGALSGANSTVWIARGTRDGTNNLLPGRVQITGTTGQIYVSYGTELPENGLVANGEYLVIRDGCTCSWLPPYLASNHPGLVQTFGLTSSYVVTRVNNTDGRVFIGQSSIPKFNAYYTNSLNIQVPLLNYPAVPIDVLTCESTTDMSTKPTVNFGTGTGKACGLWTEYQGNNWPASNGFAFTDRYGNTAYIGRGSGGGYSFAGRVQLTGTVGVYLTWAAVVNQEYLTSFPEYLVVPNNCNCQWVAYSSAKTRTGLVRTLDHIYGFAIGRISIGSGKYILSSVYTTTNVQFYVGTAGVYTSDVTPSELLVCET